MKKLTFGEIVADASATDEYYRAEEVDAVLKRQAAAAIAGMNAAKAISSHQVDQAYRLNRESSPEALESERSANALLTEELEQWKTALSQLRGLASTCLALKPTSGMMRHALEKIAGLTE